MGEGFARHDGSVTPGLQKDSLAMRAKKAETAWLRTLPKDKKTRRLRELIGKPVRK